MVRLGRVVVVGVGLIGGSVGMAVRARRLAGRVVGVGRDGEDLGEAVRLGAIDEASTDLDLAAAGADLVAVCTPVAGIAATVRLVAAVAPAGVLVVDAGSTKRTVVEGVESDDRARVVFVGGHPLAGSERSGVGAAAADLFEGRVCVLTPTPRTPEERLRRARSFWASLGCRLVELDPAAHDRAVALTSHLPHAVAAALAGAVPEGMLGLAAGAYRDGTRVAAAETALWAGIFLENRRPVLDALDRFDAGLAVFRRALAAGDEPGLREWWDDARARRRQFESPADQD